MRKHSGIACYQGGAAAQRSGAVSVLRKLVVELLGLPPIQYAYLDVTTVPLSPPCSNYQRGYDKTPGCGQRVGMIWGLFVSVVSGTGSLFWPRWAPSCAVWQPQGLCFSIESLSFLSPCPLTSLPNAERTPGIKYKSSGNRKQRLETELQPHPKPGNSSALVLGARDFKLHILQSG